MHDTETGGEPRAFHATRWSCVLAAKDPSAPERRAALEDLIQAYWKPLYGFLRRKGHDVEAAKDYTQGFFAAFLELDYLKYVEKGRGKFRTFLLTALEHWMCDQFDRAHAKKRGGGAHLLSLDFLQAEREFPVAARPDDTPDAVYRRQWALVVLERAIQALRAQFESAGRGAEFKEFRQHLGRDDAPSYAEMAKRLGLTHGEVRNRLHRARKSYRDMILAEVRTYTDGEEAALEEIRDLFAAFA